ncbi:MAG: serine/threonine-protein kinase [Kofleriaceae bacterium]
MTDDTDLDVDATEVTRREGAGPRKPPVEQLDRGSSVGRYIVIDVIGAGGMGVVYSAYDPVLDRRIALKLLQAKPARGSRGDQAWLLREAQAMARLSHPNVIAVHDVGTLPGDRVFVAMELVDGMTLRSWLREEPRPWPEVLPVMLAAGTGLAAAHASGLVHRDFKPDNVLVGSDGRVRVMDFGLARLRSEHDTLPAPPSDRVVESESALTATLTLAGTVVGTPAYMAPELYQNVTADARSDQFAFGVAMYEALFRARPFARGDHGTPAKPPPEVGVPATIQRVVMRAIAIDPGDRYPALADMLAELAIDTRAPRRRALVAAGAALCLGAAVVGGFALRSRSEPAAAALPPPCTGIERRLDGAWDPATKQSIKTAFAATKRPFAATSYVGLERALDAYATEWTKVAVDNCQATRIRGDQAEDVLSLRGACLDQRLEELRALSRVLAKADAPIVEKGDKVAYGLEPLARCSNVAALRAPGQPPTEPKAKLAALYAELAQSKAELLAGRYFPSLNAAAKAAALADEIHYEPFKAEALLVNAAALVGAGNAEQSTITARQAAWSAVRGRRDDILAGAALSSALVASDRKLGEAQIWIGLAKAAAERLRDRSLEQRVLQVEALIAALGGDLEGAIASQQKALAAAEQIFGPENPQIWSDVEVIGITFAKTGAWDKAQPHFERALRLREASVGPDHPDVALMLTNLGACYAHVGQADKARATYERSVSIRERTEGASSPMMILTLNNMADGLIRAKDTAGALLYTDRAKSLAAKLLGTDNALYHATMTTRAEALAAAQQLAAANTEYDEVIALETAANSPLLAATLTSRATFAIARKRWIEAAALAQRAIAAIEAAGGKAAPDLWQPLASLGHAQLELGRRADARSALERAIAVAEKAQISTTDLAPVRASLERAR